MSSTAATAVEAPPAPAGKGKKKLIIIIAAALAVVLAGGGAGAYFLLKKKPADTEAEAEAGADGNAADHAAPAKATSKADAKNPPVFVPLEHFTVNLADRDAERYAQIAVTLEIDDAKVGEQIKLYMPAIRNNILMAIADRTAGELMERQGKAQLAERIKRETSRAIGYDVGPEEDDAAAGPEAAARSKARAKKRAQLVLPVRAVHFSNFIIQ